MFNIVVKEKKEFGYGVDARKLWEGLEVNTEFNHWIKRRLDECLAVAGVDFCEYSSNLAKNNGRGRPTIEYLISLDTAKHIAMLERTDKGKAIRQFFIDCEKRLTSGEWKEHRLDCKDKFQELIDTIDEVLEPNNSFQYINSSNLINKVVFGMNHKQWKEQYTELAKNGKNQRDYATMEELHVISSLQSVYASLLLDGCTYEEIKTKLYAYEKTARKAFKTKEAKRVAKEQKRLEKERTKEERKKLRLKEKNEEPKEDDTHKKAKGNKRTPKGKDDKGRSKAIKSNARTNKKDIIDVDFTTKKASRKGKK